jgi:hypothetical protein
MRAHVVVGESDAVAAAVIVNRKIYEPFIPTGHNMFADEGCLKHAVAALTRHVVDPVNGEVQVAREETDAAAGLSQTSGNDSTMLVAIARK